MDIARSNLEKVREDRTAQGFYVLSPGGEFLGFNNNRSVERVHGLMSDGRRAYLALGDEEVDVGDELVAAPFTPLAPESATVALVYSRIRPVPEGARATNRYLGRDFLWILREEVEALLDADAEQPELPPALLSRLVRYHLVDNVRGEPPMWSNADIRALEVKLVRSADSFALSGSFELRTANDDRGYVGSLEGTLSLERGTRRVSALTLLAEGEAWGRGHWTPGQPKGRFPLLVAFVLPEEGDSIARGVPSQAASCGLDYIRAGTGASR